ncbi:MAG: hypothetical protein AAF724_09045 [Pseudomonadota bacterium]
MENGIVATLVSFAGMLEPYDQRSGLTGPAQARGWIDASGQPTQEGMAVFRAITEQDSTRSAFRGL